jgi:hypothetical protein
MSSLTPDAIISVDAIPCRQNRRAGRAYGRRATKMSLTKDLLDVSLGHKCPSCGHSHQRLGKIFRAITHYMSARPVARTCG